MNAAAAAPTAAGNGAAVRAPPPNGGLMSPGRKLCHKSPQFHDPKAYMPQMPHYQMPHSQMIQPHKRPFPVYNARFVPSRQYVWYSNGH